MVIFPFILIIFIILLFLSINHVSAFKTHTFYKTIYFHFLLLILTLSFTFISPMYGFIMLIISLFILFGSGHFFEESFSNMIDIANSKNKNERLTSTNIPKIIIQIWVEKDDNPKPVSAEFKRYMDQFKKMNPDYQHMFFGKKEVESLLRTNYPQYWDTYNRLPRFIQKMDFARYVILYHYGGFYFDLDVEPLKPLDDSIRNHSAVFPIDNYIQKKDCSETRYDYFCKNKTNILLGQYAFGCVTNHPFLKMVIDNIHQNIETYIEKLNPSQDYVYQTTGPDFVTNMFLNYQDKESIYILSNGKRQMFGDYGKHNYVGTWK